MSVLLCLFGWWWRICGGWFIFRYTTFFNIYYVNLDIVRNNGLTVARSPAASFAVSWLNFEPRSQSFPAIKVAIATFIAFATMVYFLCVLNSIDFSNLTVKINIMIIRKRGE